MGNKFENARGFGVFLLFAKTLEGLLVEVSLCSVLFQEMLC